MPVIHAKHFDAELLILHSAMMPIHI